MATQSPRDNASSELNDLSRRVIGLAMKVHSVLGPGLLESVYEVCLEHELRKAGIEVIRQLPLPVYYDGIHVDAGFRIDLLVDQQLVLELKSVDRLLPVHEAQLITYLRLSDLTLGLLINFNVVHLRDGICRRVHNLQEN